MEKTEMSLEIIDKFCGELVGRPHYHASNIDNFCPTRNKGDSRDFLIFCVAPEQAEWWAKFLEYRFGCDFLRVLALPFLLLLTDLPTLPTEVYTYCKEKEDG